MTRRSFLNSAALGLAAGAAVPLLTAATKRNTRKGYKLGSNLGGKGTTLREQFQMIKNAGFEGVEPMAALDRAEVLKARDAVGLEIPSVCCNTHWVKPLSDPNPATREVTVEALKYTLEDAKAYGAKSILLVPAVVNAQISYEDAYKRSQEEIRKAIPTAEKLGVKIAIENVWNGFHLSPIEAARYVDEFKSPFVAWHFDIGNVISIGWPEHWIRILGKRIATLHIKEYSRKKQSEQGPRKGFEVEYLEGENDWPAIMTALDDIKFEGWGIAEPAYRPANVPIEERLKEIASRMDKMFSL